MAAELPDWLTAGDPPAPNPSREANKLACVQFDVFLPRILDRLCEGWTLSKAIKELPVALDHGAFMRWLRKNPEKYELYKEAKEIRTEAWAGKIIEHALAEWDDGRLNIEDTARSRLIVDTYKWLMGADNRKQYGDTKTVEVNSNISITAALAQANERVGQIVDAEYEELTAPPRLLSSGEEDEDDE